MKSNNKSGRIQLGRVTTATLGSTFGAIERVGLYLPGAGITIR